MFPATRGIFDKSTRQQKEQFFKDLDDLMFTGNIAERELNPEVLGRVSKMMKDKNLPKADRDQIIFSIQNARKEMTNLINIVEEFPGAISSKDIQSFRSIIGNRYKDYLGNTYKIFENKSSIPFAN